jgi:hypothetical protein
MFRIPYVVYGMSCFEKQTQFDDRENDVNLYIKGIYEDICGFVGRENKANSKPIAGLWLNSGALTKRLVSSIVRIS